MREQSDKEYILQLTKENKELKQRCEDLLERLRHSEYERFYGQSHINSKALI